MATDSIVKHSGKPLTGTTRKLQISSWLKLLGSHFKHDWEPAEFEHVLARLSRENPKAVERAIGRCFDELQYFPHLADILSRIEPPELGEARTIFIDRVTCQAEDFSKPPFAGRFLCGCGKCNPDYWCRIPWCKLPRQRANAYCECHADEQLRRAEAEAAHELPEATDWQVRAEELAPQGRKGLETMIAEMKAAAHPKDMKRSTWYSIGDVLAGGALGNRKAGA